MEVVIFLFLISSCYGSLLDIFGREQSVGVEGTLLCNGKAAAGVDLLLYDIEVLENTALHRGRTDKSGHFKLWGTKIETTDIEPELLLYHQCNFKQKNPYCAKKKRIPIPSKYIVQGTSVKKYYNIGRLDLSSNKWDDGFKRCHLYSGIIN
ncbi:hypothetical protein Y032_0062g3351 [Ancylostoma ceylanicum]|uniref:Transthyretin-like family protein n=1 Tax=Ancylostoma ceylanicum TaxID=53326 RepID=A0A016U2M2_9BILA|nr:hypothetical protein Y032_0062g3351 [Ancylostoma ceylanicum]